MDFTPKLADREISGAAGTRGFIPQHNATFRTPRPWTFLIEAGLLAYGSSRPSSPSRNLPAPVAFPDGCSPLTVAGAAPALRSPSWATAHRIPVLASNPCESKEPRTLYIVDKVRFPSTTMINGRQDRWDKRYGAAGRRRDFPGVSSGGKIVRRRRPTTFRGWSSGAASPLRPC